MSPRSAIVLAGGLGTRLRPLTEMRPKQMLPIVDRPMIEHVVAKLAAEGVDDVVLSLGYRPDAFGVAYPSGRCGGAGLRYATESEPLGTAGALLFAARRAAADNGTGVGGDPFAETFWALNGDVLTDAPLSELLALHRARGAEATILTIPMADASRYGLVESDGTGRVSRFVEKPASGAETSGWINAGVYVLEPSVLARIPPGRPVSMERETFAAVAADGSLYALRSEDYWIDAGTPASYLQANIDLISGRRAITLGALSPRATISPAITMLKLGKAARNALPARGSKVTSPCIQTEKSSGSVRIAQTVSGLASISTDTSITFASSSTSDSCLWVVVGVRGCGAGGSPPPRPFA